MNEKLFDDAIQISSMKSKEELDLLKPLHDSLFYQLAQSAEEMKPILLQALQTSDFNRVTTAIEVIDFMGYPRNEFAIPGLLACIGSSDPNGAIWTGALFTLSHIGKDIVVPHLIRALLERGEPYHYVINGITSWGEDLEGLCTLLAGTNILESEYASQCCPTINCLLMQVHLDSSFLSLEQIDYLLWVVEAGGKDATYLLPTLINLMKQHQGDKVGRTVEKLLSSFSQEVLQPYKLILYEIEPN